MRELGSAIKARTKEVNASRAKYDAMVAEYDAGVAELGEIERDLAQPKWDEDKRAVAAKSTARRRRRR